MEHLLCINTNSFPASDVDTAKKLFMDSIQGVLELFVTSDDRVVFYLDEINNIDLQDLELSADFKYSDFLVYLEDKHEYDLLSVLYDIEDKSPALDFFDDTDLDVITEYTYYLTGQQLPSNPSIFSIAEHLSAKLLSLATSPQWCEHQINLNRTRDGEFNQDSIVLDNISSQHHGKLLYELYNSLDLKNACPEALLSEDILSWFQGLTDENKHIAYKKLSYCHVKGFRGGEPLFKSLNDAGGLWEVRFDAFKGGTIRVLYKLSTGTVVLLVGFIKKSNSDGYDQNINRANKTFDALLIG